MFTDYPSEYTHRFLSVIVAKLPVKKAIIKPAYASTKK
jgi:hypothetical protein